MPLHQDEDPVGFKPEPDPTFEKRPDGSSIKNRIRIRPPKNNPESDWGFPPSFDRIYPLFFSFDIKVNIIDTFYKFIITLVKILETGSKSDLFQKPDPKPRFINKLCNMLMKLLGRLPNIVSKLTLIHPEVGGGDNLTPNFFWNGCHFKLK